jgi:hypothetical protein
MPVIPALRRLKLEECECEASLGYTKILSQKNIALNWRRSKPIIVA